MSNQHSSCTAFEIAFFKANTENSIKHHANQIHIQSKSGFPPKTPQAVLKSMCLDLFIEEVGFEEGFFPHFWIFNLQRKASGLHMMARAYKVGNSPFIKFWRTSGWKPAKDTKYCITSLDIQKTEKATFSQADRTLLEVCYLMERANQSGK